MSKFICLLISSLLVLPITVEAQKYQNIVRDYRNDAGGDPENPFRLQLKAQKDLKSGRMAAVWGSIGGDDEADSFFLGKTPDLARLQFDLTSLGVGDTITLTVTAKEGQDVEHHKIEVTSGDSQKVWLRLRGKLVARITAVEATNYALYVWYPGDLFDALTENEFEDVIRHQGMEKPHMVRIVRGDGK